MMPVELPQVGCLTEWINKNSVNENSQVTDRTVTQQGVLKVSSMSLIITVTHKLTRRTGRFLFLSIPEDNYPESRFKLWVIFHIKTHFVRCTVMQVCECIPSLSCLLLQNLCNHKLIHQLTNCRCWILQSKHWIFIEDTCFTVIG
jgi:hypothetical protein